MNVEQPFVARVIHDGIPALPGQSPEVQGTQIPTQAVNGIPQFFVRRIKLENGQHEDREYVNIITPGDNKTVVTQKVTDRHREVFRPYYDLWKQGRQMEMSGTPIDMWPVIQPGLSRELKALNIFTVEQLRDISDANLTRIPMGRTLKEQARQFLENKATTDEISARNSEKQAQAEAMAMMERQMEEQRQQIARLTALLEQNAAPKPEPDEPAKRGPGRPPKSAA